MAATGRRTNVEIVEGAYEAFNGGDMDALMGAIHEDVEWHELEGSNLGGTYHGHDEVAGNVFGPTAELYEGFQAVPDEFVDGGDTIVVLGSYQGTVTETGSSIDGIPFAHVLGVTDGRISSFTNYTDTQLFARAFEA
jgi:hypothetical protein